jgi:hypothetical protein
MNRPPSSDDGAFDRAWTAFSRHERAVGAQAALEVRLRRSLIARAHAGGRTSRWPRRRAAFQVAAGMAACLVAAVAGRSWVRPVERLVPPDPPVAVSRRMTLPEAAAPVPLVAGLELPAPRQAARVRRAIAPEADPPSPAAPPTLAVLAANGPLQVIRVRIAASALDALGVAVTGPAGTGLVDVDLVVGADGWPMDVRRIRPVTADGPSR